MHTAKVGLFTGGGPNKAEIRVLLLVRNSKRDELALGSEKTAKGVNSAQRSQTLS